tara:strand:- start:95 stop:517 length:423 start_codon:yes stop_codon:yes gene_type:complete
MIEFLDLPDPPCYLDIESVKLKKNEWEGNKEIYGLYTPEKELLNFLKSTFLECTRFRYQTLKDGIPRHTDVVRPVCYNYILEAGGSNVQTVWWESDKEIYRICLPEKRWHKINTTVEHTIENIETERLSITVYIINNSLQ